MHEHQEQLRQTGSGGGHALPPPAQPPTSASAGPLHTHLWCERVSREVEVRSSLTPLAFLFLVPCKVSTRYFVSFSELGSRLIRGLAPISDLRRPRPTGQRIAGITHPTPAHASLHHTQSTESSGEELPQPPGAPAAAWQQGTNAGKGVCDRCSKNAVLHGSRRRRHLHPPTAAPAEAGRRRPGRRRCCRRQAQAGKGGRCRCRRQARSSSSSGSSSGGGGGGGGAQQRAAALSDEERARRLLDRHARGAPGADGALGR